MVRMIVAAIRWRRTSPTISPAKGASDQIGNERNRSNRPPCEVGREPHPGIDRVEDDGLDQNARQEELEIVARRTRERAAEHEGEQQREHDRRHDQVEQLLGHVTEFQEARASRTRVRWRRPRESAAVPRSEGAPSARRSIRHRSCVVSRIGSPSRAASRRRRPLPGWDCPSRSWTARCLWRAAWRSPHSRLRGCRAMMDSSPPSALRWVVPPRQASSSLRRLVQARPDRRRSRGGSRSRWRSSARGCCLPRSCGRGR